MAVVYASIADVQAAIGVDRLLEIADHDGDHVLDTDTVNRALAEASSIADTYLNAGGQLPAPVPPPDALRRAVVDIAVNHLREPRDLTTEDSRRAADTAMKWLGQVGAGNATLVAPTSGTVDPGDPLIDAGDRMWTRWSSRGVF